MRLRRWVSFHGISINVEPDLTHFDAIVPCGVADPRYGVTSLVDLGHPVTMADVDIALRQAFAGSVRRRGTAPAGSDGLATPDRVRGRFSLEDVSVHAAARCGATSSWPAM